MKGPLIGLDQSPAETEGVELLPLRPGRIGLVEGEGVDVASAGSLAHLLEFRLGMTVTSVRPLGLNSELLGSLTHLIMPAGDYELIPDDLSSALADWVRHGGVLITLAGASRWVLAQHWPWSGLPGTRGLKFRAERHSMVSGAPEAGRWTGRRPSARLRPSRISVIARRRLAAYCRSAVTAGAGGRRIPHRRDSPDQPGTR